MNPPDDLIELGRILGAYGLRGWVTIAPESGDPFVLKKTKKWWISRLPETLAKPQAAKPQTIKPEDLIFEDFEVIESKMHSGKLVAHLQGVESRDLAEKFKGRRIYVSRSRFPQAGSGEYYWIDLIGCKVVNLQGVTLGEVSEVTDHGAHAILAVTPAEGIEAEASELLIPFVEAYVPEVRMAERTIIVDWQADY